MASPAHARVTAPYRHTRLQLAAIVAALLALLVLFQDTLVYLYGIWHQDEYSHGFLIPLVSGFLLWQRRERLKQLPFRSSWVGVLVAVLGLGVYFLGAVASITTVDAYALVIVVMGSALALMGGEAFKVVLVPRALLFLMNPIPNFFYYNLSSALQLVSSQLGVAFIRLCGVSVFLEGNVIDLGSYKLQVAEACSGLRYLFPLMTLGVLIAYLFRGRTWMRWCLFLSTVPITVLVNSVRIGVIGVLVDRFGITQAEGFLHDFEGWLLFMGCVLVLLGECWLLLRLARDPRPLKELFTFEPAAPAATAPVLRSRAPGRPAVVTLAILAAAVFPARALPQRTELRPARADFSEFPLQIGDWQGRRQRLETIYLDTLKLDDYLLADFARRPGSLAPSPATANDLGDPVNLYIAYYTSQRAGQSAHSPRSCLPGGGWRILDFRQQELEGVRRRDAPLWVNRALVQHGAERELVYYWFQQRGRSLTNEYLVKWYLFEDALLRNRTDGALVRLVTPLGVNEPPGAADRRLAQFSGSVLARLERYVPN